MSPHTRMPPPLIGSSVLAGAGWCEAWTIRGPHRDPVRLDTVERAARHFHLDDPGPGKGPLTMPALGLTVPARVQLQAGDGQCWEAGYSTATKNTPEQFEAKSNWQLSRPGRSSVAAVGRRVDEGPLGDPRPSSFPSTSPLPVTSMR